MKSYIMTWNPANWPWDQLDDQVQQLQANGSVEEQWSCGNRKNLPVGSRVFLFKQGSGLRGIMGVGSTLSEPREEPHYNPEYAKNGKTATRVNIRWFLLKNKPVIPLDRLMLPPFSDTRWVFQASGIEIERKISDALLMEWHILSQKIGFCLPEEEVVNCGYVEGTVYPVLTNKYERNLRAREKCIEHWKPRCAVCGFDFGSTYGEIADGFIHVHHIKSLHEIKSNYEVDPIQDLRPVCPNCHAVLHMKNPPMSIDDLKKKLSLI